MDLDIVFAGTMLVAVALSLLATGLYLGHDWWVGPR